MNHEATTVFRTQDYDDTQATQRYLTASQQCRWLACSLTGKTCIAVSAEYSPNEPVSIDKPVVSPCHNVNNMP